MNTRPRPEIRQAARDLRARSTRSEALLWEALRDRRLAGRKFRRQHPVGPFVLDFYCYEERLAVEVDGGVHAAQEEADWERQSVAEAMGIRVVRVPAGLVENGLPKALGLIEAALRANPSPAHGRGVSA